MAQTANPFEDTSAVSHTALAPSAMTSPHDLATLPPAIALHKLDSDSQTGLTAGEAAKRLRQYGENILREEAVSPLKKLLSFFWGPIPWMIEAAAVLSALVQHWAEFGIILVMLLLNVGVGFWQEYKADNAIALLKQKLALRARVLRDSAWQDVAASQLVPGDIIQIRLGNILPADCKLLEGDYLSVDQSALTGESLQVDKKVGDVTYSGAIVRQGEMKALVTATGMHTYFGKTAQLVQEARTVSHFQRAVLRIGNFLILTTVGLVIIILLAALFRHDPWADTLLFALILTVAAIPVALPAVLSVTMAIGAERLAGQQAIVSRLVAIEEMAGVDVLCADKTGTLTQNKLSVGEPVLMDAKSKEDLLQAAALASEASSNDPIDQAILRAAGKSGPHLTGTRFHPFDPVRKYAAAEYTIADRAFEVAKGAPQVIMQMAKLDQSAQAKIAQQVETLATAGYRTLGVARKEGGRWRFLGLVPLFDPPRADSAQTIARIRQLGIQIKMVTGDHLAIARQIAAQLHLGLNILPADQVFNGEPSAQRAALIRKADGFAQVFPEHKFELVKTLQADGHIVGMTGDGVNDAPALKQADVGIAVSGATDAARSAADLVLTAPGLSVIARAIEEARQIFERMNSYATYRIAETIRVLLFMTASILVFNFYPVTAVMIVLIALLNDIPIMTIAYDHAPLSSRPVKWNMHRMLMLASLLGGLGVIATFLLYWLARDILHLSAPVIQSVIFLKLLVAGHLTIYLTRNKGAIWQKPYPSWKLIGATETTQALGTLIAVYGWFIPPIGWRLALLVWGYALGWFLVNSAAKVLVYRLMDYATRDQAHHLKRTESTLHATS